MSDTASLSRSELDSYPVPARHADEVDDPAVARRAERYRVAADQADPARREAADQQDAGSGGVNLGVQVAKIVVGLAVMIGGLLYIKHVSMPEADMAYVAVMLVFLLLMMCGGGLLTSGVQTIVRAARDGGK